MMMENMEDYTANIVLNPISTNTNYYNYHDLTYPLSVVTPPMSGSEGSMSPNSGLIHLNSYYETMNIDEDTAPCLVIKEQPVEKFRFRYKSEIVGTHGCLNGISSSRNRKSAFPTVELKNFNETAIIRCSLYQCSKGGVLKGPHAHRLVQKLDKEEMDDPHDVIVNASTGYTTSFKNMGIVHTAKKFLVDELKRKKLKLKKEEMARNGEFRPLSKAEDMLLVKECTEESKDMNLNVVCLRFDAFVKVNEALHPICGPVFSNEIKNLKSALTGDLKIVRMDHCTSPVAGGREIYLLVEKVAKKNISVRFYEEDDNEQMVWYADARFNDNDVHHQYAIVIKTPPYRDQDIEEEKKVFVELLRPSDGACSDSLEFTYYPDRNRRRKRPRFDNSSSSYNSLSSGEIPTTIATMSGDLFLFSNQVNSDDFYEIMKDLDFRNSFESLQPDSVNTGKSCNLPAELNKFKIFLDNFCTLVQTKPKVERIKLMIDNYLAEMKTLGKNPLHIAFTSKEIYMKGLDAKLEIFLNFLQMLKMKNVLNEQVNGETVLHVAVNNGNMRDVQQLLKYGVDPCIRDISEGNTPLHVAAKISPKCLLALIQSHMLDKFIDLQNNDGYTALQLAILNNNLEAVQALCNARANKRVIDNKNGRSLMQIAINEQFYDIVEFFTQMSDTNYDHLDYCDKTCQELAFMLKDKDDNGHKIYQMLEAHLKRIGKYKICEIKAEVDSDNDDLEIDYPHMEATPEQIREMYCRVSKFTDTALDKLSGMLNTDGKWQKLLHLLDLSHLSNTDIFDKNPTKTLLELALTMGTSIYQIRMALENIEVHEAVQCLDDMVRR